MTGKPAFVPAGCSPGAGRRIFHRFFIALAVLAVPGLMKAQDELPGAREVVAAVLTNQRSSGFVARARLESRQGDGPARAVQILAKGRRDGALAEVMVVAMWPADVKGQAVVVKRRDGGEASGFRFTPPAEVERLDRFDMDDPLFGTGLCVDDLTESFWEWPEQKIAGSAKHGHDDCWILESRPRGVKARHAVVRSWIAKGKNLPVLIEKAGKEGKTVVRVSVERSVKRDDGGWSPVEMLIESRDSGWRTRVTFSRGERGLTLPASDFSPEAVKALGGGK